jgi:uncharacterized protein YraI
MKLRGILIAALLLIVPTAAMAARGIVTDTVSLRAGPGVGFPVVDRIPGGAHVNIHGCLRGDAWCDISWAGDRGWVSSEYLQYFYRSRYVYLPDYVDVIDVPVVPFVLGTYWANYYAGRPFFHRRAHWASYWRSHARIAEQPVRGGAIARTRGGEERFGRVDREQRGFRENRAFRENMERGRTARIERGAFERRGGVGINERRGVSVNERRGIGFNERRGLGVNERRGVAAGMRQPVAGPQGRIEGRQFGHGGQPAFQARGGEPRAMGRPPMAAGAGAGPRTVGQAGGASQAQMGGGPRAPAAAPHAMGGGAPHMAAPGGGGGMAGPRGGGHGRPH